MKKQLNIANRMLEEKQQILPNLLIVGAAKSGTSLLSDCLGQHPEIYMSAVKEPQYFVPNLAVNSFEEYISLFDNKKSQSAKIRGEASTGYLCSEDATFAIKENLPNTKIIIMLRNPVDMVFSLWAYKSRRGSETESFEAAIANQSLRASEEYRKTHQEWPYAYLYVERAKYYQQVKRYLDLFDQEQIKIFIFEEFLQDKEKSFQEIFDFLEVASDFQPTIKRVNIGGAMRFKPIEQLIQKDFPLIKNIIPLVWRHKIRYFLRDFNVKTEEKPVLTDSMRRELTDVFREDVESLESLLGRELWNSLK